MQSAVFSFIPALLSSDPIPVEETIPLLFSGLQWLYLLCAIVGSVLVLFQFLVSLLGFGDDVDVDVDADVDVDMDTDTEMGSDAGADTDTETDISGSSHSLDLARYLSFRVIVVTTAFFGIFGCWGSSAHQNPWITFILATTLGLFAGFCVGKVMEKFKKMGADGTTHLENAVGQSATVYVKIAAKRAMAGKIQIVLDGRSETMAAVTDGPELVSGTSVVVIEVLGKETAVVEPKD